MLLLCSGLLGVYISFIDLKTGLIPRYIVLGATVCVLVYQFFFSNSLFTSSALGCFFGLAIFGITRIVAKKKLGLGDIWVAAFLGAVLGIPLIYPAFFLACIFVLAAMIAVKKKKMPFTPFMFCGAMVAVCLNRMTNFLNLM